MLLALSLIQLTTNATELEQVARKHRAQFKGQEGYYYYVSGDKDQIKTLSFVLASTSTQYIVERIIPQEVSEGLYVVNLTNLHWEWQQWFKVLAAYPYYVASEDPTGYKGRTWPIVIRADWLIVALTDTNEYQFSYNLLYGEHEPKTIQQFRAFWKVDEDKKYARGMIEGDSGVSLQRIRQLENHPVPRGYYWQTKDVLNLKNKTKDPLGNLDKVFKYDGQEAIVGVEKISIHTRKTGTIQYYFLADGADKRVEKADGDLVEDHTRFRGYAQIRTTGSCIQCHVQGINEPTQDALRKILAVGVQVLTPDKTLQERIELFYLSSLGKQLQRNREDYADGIELINGLDPETNVEAFRAIVLKYDKALTLTTAAEELGIAEDELKLAIAYLNNANTVDVRLAALVQGEPIPRQVWERSYADTQLAIKVWRDKK